MVSTSRLILQGSTLSYGERVNPTKESMSAPAPITQRDVAQACGLHPSTVCLALKNAPSIPEETRRRIQAEAARLGYQPNVAARNLALLRTEKKHGGSLPLAWINQEPRRDHWRTDPVAKVYFEGARRRAEEAGYHLEEIWTREPGMTPARVGQIVRARGVDGVIFPVDRSFDFALLQSGWSECALVGFNDHRLAEWIDVVCPDYHRNVAAALRGLRQLGYDRIGLVLTPQLDAASHGLAHGCFLREQATLSPAERVPVCFLPDTPETPREIFREWLLEQSPEVVIGRDPRLLSWAPPGRDVAWVQLHGDHADFQAGIDPGAAEVAAAAVDCVVEKVRRFERGMRDATRVHLVQGAWQPRQLAGRERVARSA
jgi:LacI family transcriptional regulator